MADTCKPESPPLPVPDELTQQFWAGVAVGELRLQRCADCAMWVHPPEPFCGECGSNGFRYEAAPLTGRVHSWVVMRDQRVRGYSDRVPYVNVWAELDVQRGLILLANLAPDEEEDLAFDAPVVVGFETVSDELTLPCFRLVRR